MKKVLSVLAVLAVAALLASAYFWWQQNRPPPPSFDPRSTAETGSPDMTTPAPAVIQYPIEATSAARGGLPPMPMERDISTALTELLGRDAVLSFVRLNDVVRHIVVTVDNLPRPFAASQLWPVNPTPGRLITEDSDGQLVLAASNERRYTPLVRFLEAIDTPRGVALYVQHYPLFQQQYEALGYPGQYFNDRLVAVIDHLLQTPNPPRPLKLLLVEVKGPEPSSRPWVRHELADPALEGLSSGQKMLIRVGPEHQKVLMAKLVELRAQVAGKKP